MERAARVFRGDKSSRQLLTDDDYARAVWPQAVGKKIAAHTSRVRMVRSTLVVEVEDAMWQRQLHGLTAQILQRIRKITGSDAIQDLEFRIGIPRMQPQRVETAGADSQQAQDDAERIEDPVLQRLYRISRKKATA